MKKAFRIVSFVFLGIILLLFVFYLVKNESLPEGTSGTEADEMAKRMMESLNYEAWEATPEISWTFKGIHSYEWDKMENIVTVRWDNHEVILNPEDKSGVVQSGENYSASEIQELIETSWNYFNNDSFWLYAPFKVFDPGTERSIVTLKDGRKGLKVTYTSGGTSPGDSYVWILDENYRPTSVKMWVSILPLGGMEFTWENYLTLETGALIAQDHFLYASVNIDISQVETDLSYYEGVYENAFQKTIDELPGRYTLNFVKANFFQSDLNRFSESLRSLMTWNINLDSNRQNILESISDELKGSIYTNKTTSDTVTIFYSSPIFIKENYLVIGNQYQFGSGKTSGSLGYILMKKGQNIWEEIFYESLLEF